MSTVITTEMITGKAKEILLESDLMVNGKRYRIREIEFYIRSPSHNDEYTHGHPDQKTMDCWYFHRFKNGSYRGGTYKGMDLTMGDEKTFGGILIRSIEHIGSGTLIEGPCRVVNHILERYQVDGISDLVSNEDRQISLPPGGPMCATKNGRGFVVVKRKNPRTEQILCGPRIGLSDKFPRWRKRKYRFVCDSTGIKKSKKQLELLNGD